MLKPAFQFIFLASTSHVNAPVMDWELQSWPDEETMEFKLNFDNPTIVCMQMPQDFVQIDFYDETLFNTENGAQVGPGY